MVEICTGSGGHVFTYEGPQFGAQVIEEPCETCGQWHESEAERREAGPRHRRNRWFRRRGTRTTVSNAGARARTASNYDED